MLQTPIVETVPDVFDLAMRPQVVDVPVRPARELAMMGKPGPDASGSKRAADINIEARPEPQSAEPSSLDQVSRSRRKNQDVSHPVFMAALK